jgi:phenylpropionate dioxygenase-like ring-hydroxylating dioxygenase large terminal subunit
VSEQNGFKVSPNDYFDENYFNQELENILNNYWIFICPEKILKKENDYFLFNGLGKDIVIKKVSENKIVSFNNVCMHRGHKLFSETFGNSETRCPYHGWLYDNNLALKNIPWNDKCIHLSTDQVFLEKFNQIKVQDGCVWGYFGKSDSNKALYPASKVSETLNMFDQFSESPVAISVSKRRFNWKLIFENLYDRVHPVFLHKKSLNLNFQIDFDAFPNDFSLEGVEDFVVGNVEKIGEEKKNNLNSKSKIQFPLTGYINGHIFPFLHFLTPNSGGTFSYESYLPINEKEVLIYTFFLSSSTIETKYQFSMLSEHVKGAAKVLNEDWNAVESISNVKEKPKSYLYGAHEKNYYGLKKLGEKK